MPQRPRRILAVRGARARRRRRREHRRARRLTPPLPSPPYTLRRDRPDSSRPSPDSRRIPSRSRVPLSKRRREPGPPPKGGVAPAADAVGAPALRQEVVGGVGGARRLLPRKLGAAEV